MDISSFVVTVAQLFLIDKEITPGFDASRKKYVIPKYQREYKWPAEKVQTLISDIKQFTTFNAEKAYALYSLIDNYSAADNYLTLLYDFPDYNKEHLIAHNNNALNITWKDDSEFVFSLKELIGKPNKKTYQATQYRSLTANYIILPSSLNEDLGQADIVYKINKIREYYRRIEKDIPTHIDLFLGHIEKMPEYKKLSEMKGEKKRSRTLRRHTKTLSMGISAANNRTVSMKRLSGRLKMLL